MPGPSIETLITRDVIATLGNVSPANGYPVTLLVTDPVQRKPSPVNGTAYVVVGDSVPSDDTPVGWRGWVLTVEINCVIIQDDTSTIPIRELVSEYAASVEKALYADVSRGGYALETTPVGRFPDYPREGEAWVQLNYEIVYRTLIQDPFNPQ